MFSKPKTLAETMAEIDDLFAKIMRQFDDIDATVSNIKAGMIRDGLIRDPNAQERATDQQAAA